ncbi:MAG: hypothetical protein ACREOD_01050 [Candidatus Dormibacteria bacterium]
MNRRSSGRRSQPPPSPEEARAKAERRRRGLQVSTVCLHGMAWILVTFYATDYLPPLAIRLTVGVSSPRPGQYLLGYAVLGAICLILGGVFGRLYRQRIAASRYRWRWVVFPAVLALLLIPSQGFNEWLTRLVELACVVGGIGAGAAFSRPARPRWSQPAVSHEDAH